MTENSKFTPDRTPEAVPVPVELTVGGALGEIAWLMAQSAAHRHFFLADLEWMVLPPVTLGQYRLFQIERRPVAVAFWAHLTAEIEQRLENGLMRLKPTEWAGGDRLWLIDLIAPFGHAEAFLADLRRTVFAGQTFNLFRIGEDGKRHRATIEGEPLAPKVDLAPAGAKVDPATPPALTPKVN